MTKTVEQLDRVIIRFAGDSGDGMQLTGDRFTSETAVFGNDIATFPDFPAEIRAPAGSLPGVSGFQVHFADHDILTPGDHPDVLVAMNPAALKTNLKDLPKGATLIVNTDAFVARNLDKAGYAANPLEDGSLADWQVHPVAVTTMTLESVKGIEGITPREGERAKNMFALGLMCWLFGRPTQGTIDFINAKFSKRPEIAAANIAAFNAGYHFGETSETFAISYEVKPAKLKPGKYRQINGNSALVYGPIGAAIKLLRADGVAVDQAHLMHLNPFPRNLGEVLKSYDKILMPEMNLGQLRQLVRSEFLVDAHGYNRVTGKPFKASELAEAILALVNA